MMDWIEALSLISFLIGLANYKENVGQSELQDTITAAVDDIHAHLIQQDAKLERIERRLNDDGKRDTV